MAQSKAWITMLQGASLAFLSVLVLYSLIDGVIYNVASTSHSPFERPPIYLSWVALGIGLATALSVGFVWRGKVRWFFIPFVVSSVVVTLIIFLVTCLGDMSFAN